MTTDLNEEKNNNEALDEATDNKEQANINENAANTESTETEKPDEEKTNEAETEEKKEPTVEEKLAEAEATIAKLKEQALYKQAEFDNFRKRSISEKAELILNGGQKVITTLLPIIDDLERAQNNMDKMEDIAAVKEGVNLIVDKFLKLLAKEGLKKIDAVGKDFDTDYHEAIALVPGLPEDQKNKVIDCVECGYTLNDKVIRHSKVAVAQ
ncbi:MAG: nucleotide exchange factor GrpE [Bacteroidaceae bacterium]|nr:nucleotide exchange factor GrpE [Bacteroidaceae bacterium]